MQARTVAPSELTSTQIAAWSECAALALEPNPFFEPQWLVPALRYLEDPSPTKLVFVEHKGAISACVPVVEVTANQASLTAATTNHSGLKTMVARTAVSLGTPLVTAHGGQEALACLMAGVTAEARDQSARLVIMEWMAYDGPVASMLKAVALKAQTPLIEFDVWKRGFLTRRDLVEEDYWLRGIGKNRRRSIRQHRERLKSVLGMSPLFRVRTDIAAVDEFLGLEASGWKAREPQGRALGQEAGATRFFETVCERYLKDDRMYFFSLEGADQSIAMICCVRAGEGLFAYKTAYDEDFASYGPGVEVFLAAMDYFARHSDARFFDTCSARENQHLLGLFPDERTMATVMIRVPSRPTTEP